MKSIPGYSACIIITVLFLSLLPGTSCRQIRDRQAVPFGGGARPYARYWWFASMIKEEDVRYNLDWLKAHGFGGVELAWVYPLNRFNPADTTYTPRQEWLSPEWRRIVEFTARYADSIGLGVDMTLGTLWPFGDSRVTREEASRVFGDTAWRQVITRSWEHPKPGYVVDHLKPGHYLPYLTRLSSSLPGYRSTIPSACFIDSWEVETRKLWCEDFDRDFMDRYGYDISPYMDSLYNAENRNHLYDYMSLLSDKVVKFYSDFDSVANSAGYLSRGQVAGAPCDLISGYSRLDIPEGEALLFEPEFSSIPASAALLSGKNRVSSETFTCLYGWPRDYIREEQAADLKLVADALFANGVNQIIWHGRAHNPAGFDTVNFYATTHIGDSSKLAPELKAFNRYLETVSSYMQKGSGYPDIAVYLPVEDAWLAGELPVEKQLIWSWGYYEMRYVYFPSELRAYNPAWINGEYLSKARMKNGCLSIGSASFTAVYLGSGSLDYRVLSRVCELADSGLTIIMNRVPGEPGTIRHGDYQEKLKRIMASGNTFRAVPPTHLPFITGKNIPVHWCRRDGDILYVFFPNPKAERLKFPLEYGQSFSDMTFTADVNVNFMGKSTPLSLVFEPYQSLLYSIKDGRPTKIDIGFTPAVPEIRRKPEGYRAPWLRTR